MSRFNAIRRGKNQMIFRYLPDMVIDYHQGRTIARISNWVSRPIEKINRERVIREIENRISKFKDTFGYPEEGTTSDYIFLDPINAEVELFPLMFSCQRCGKAYSFNSYDTLVSVTKGSFKCLNMISGKKCGGFLKQEHFVFIHNCGYLGQMQVPSCRNPAHGRKFVKLDKKGSIVAKNFRWICGICNHEIGSISSFCPRCRERIHTPTVFRKGQVYHPQYIRLVNISEDEIEMLYKNTDYSILMLASHLGTIEFSEVQSALLGSEKKQEDSKMRELLKDLREMGMKEEDIERVKTKHKITEVSDLSNFEDIRQQVDSYINTEELDLIYVGVNLYDYHSLRCHSSVRSIDSLIENAEKNESPQLTRYRFFQEMLNKIGISKSWVLDGFPLVVAAYGYTRDTYDPKKAKLSRYTSDANYPERIPIYVHRTETEAIILELNRSRILRWMNQNGVSGVPSSHMDHPSQKAWFLSNIHPEEIPVFAGIEDKRTPTWFVYNLLHSLSHSLIKYAAVRAGFDAGSLGEMIFPNIPAIIIYSNNQSSFQIGGLFSLFETNIHPWVDETMKGVEQCLYDPICIETTGSCHACIQLSEITCEHFNRDLDRSVLIGHKSDDLRNITGFFEVDK